MSDAHLLPTLPLCPVRTDTEYPASPSLPPCSVTLTPPVPAPFAIRSPLTNATSTDTPRLTLPTRPPTLIVKTRLPAIPDPASHRTDVSESHADRSQLVLSTRTAPET